MKFNFDKFEDHKTFDRLYPVVNILKKFVYQAEITGQENIPEEDGYVVICNHIHAVDTGIIEYAFGVKPIHFMGKSEFWDNAFIGPILTALNGFPVVRGTADMKSLKYAAELLRQGHNVGVFPEGTRQKTPELGRPKSGAALIARASHANILPMCIYYEGELSRKTVATVRIGKLIPFETLGLTDDGDNHQLKAASAVMWEHVRALWEEGPCTK